MKIDIPVSQPYRVDIAPGLLDDLGRYVSSGTAALVVTEDHVAPLLLERACRALRAAGVRAVPAILPAGEETKSLAQYAALLHKLAEAGPDPRRHGRCARRRRHRRSGGLCGRDMAARHPSGAGADDAACHGGFVRRRQDGYRPAGGQKPRRRVPSARRRRVRPAAAGHAAVRHPARRLRPRR